MRPKSKMNFVMYFEELKAIAQYCRIDLGKLVVLQFMYEFYACCTSIVTNDSSERVPIHIRTMDWDASFLKELVVELEFYKNGKPIFISTSWAGYVGIFTGTRLNAYSLSINYRKNASPSMWKNALGLLKRKWPLGFLVRNTLENRNSYYSAAEALISASLVAPCYFILSGKYRNQAMVMIRDREVCLKRRFLENHPCLIQTNEDDPLSVSFGKEGRNLLYSRQRHLLALEMLSSSHHSKMSSAEQVFVFFSTSVYL